MYLGEKISWGAEELDDDAPRWALLQHQALSGLVQVQGYSEKCAGVFKFGCCVIFYLSKSCLKAVSSVIHLSSSH